MWRIVEHSFYAQTISNFHHIEGNTFGTGEVIYEVVAKVWMGWVMLVMRLLKDRLADVWGRICSGVSYRNRSRWSRIEAGSDKELMGGGMVLECD